MRLLRHREEYIRGGRVGPLLRVEDLTAEETDLINERFIERITKLYSDASAKVLDPTLLGEVLDLQMIRDCYTSVLADHGVICPHPELSQNFYRGHRECELCGCAVITPR